MSEHDWRQRPPTDLSRLDESGSGEYRRTRWTAPGWEFCRRCGVSRNAAEHFGWTCTDSTERTET